MTTKTKQYEARCAVCEGTLRTTTITHEERRGDNIYLFQNVPAKVCDACGELWIDEEVLREIDRLITNGVPVRTVETPVYDFIRTPTTAK
jgi:YgiT-type zinc finger domain-containing protein